MNVSITLAIIGVIATIGFGLLSIDLFKRKKYPGRLILIKQSSIGLFNNISKNFDEIAILYKSNPIQENVIYLKASMLNDGDIDIDGKTVEKTISLSIKPGLKWIKSKVTAGSKELKCNSEITPGGENLEFQFGLLRKKEFFQFEALIETSNSNIDADDIYNYIDINHRIANTQKVKTITLLSEEQINRKKKRIKTFSLTIGIQFSLMILLLMFQTVFVKDAPIYYKTPESVEYSARAKYNEQIVLKNIKTNDKISITIHDLQKPDKFVPFIPVKSFWKKIESAKYLIPFFLILFLVMVSDEYIDLRRTNKYYNIFNDKENYA